MRHLRTKIFPQNWHRRVLFLILLVVLCFPGSLKPALAHPEDALQTGQPFVVKIYFAVLDIPQVNEPAETFDIDGYLGLKWTDPSAYDVVKQKIPAGATYMSSSTAEAMQTLEDIGWFYIIEIANEVGQRNTLLANLKIEPDGKIEYMERVQMTLRSVYKLNKYPFDTQTFRIRIESFAYDASEMTFEKDMVIYYRSIDSQESRLVLEDWRLPKEIETRQGVSHSQLFDSDWPYFEINLLVHRKFGYHIWKIFLPLILIVSISWSVFWIGKENVGSRLSISLIAFLTAISFNFFVSTNLPKISYLTFMDFCIIGIYIFMTLTVMGVVSTYILSNYGRESLAGRINFHSRWVFPVSLAIYLLVVVFYF